jgi:PIN domain nuclease of toxin-antitoxin system
MHAAPERLSPTARRLVTDPSNELLLSAVSAWEIAIKSALGRLRLPEPVAEYVTSRVAGGGVRPLPIEHAHALRVADLPLNHRDPFDRLLIAQAQVEGLPILTADRQFRSYKVKLLRA